VPLSELAAYFRSKSMVPAEDLIQPTAAPPGWRQPMGCDRRHLRRRDHDGTADVICRPDGIMPGMEAGLSVRAAQ